MAGLVCSLTMGSARSIGPHSCIRDIGGGIEAGTAREAAVMDDTSSAQLLSKGSAPPVCGERGADGAVVRLSDRAECVHPTAHEPISNDCSR